MTLREEVINLSENSNFEDPFKQKWIKNFVLNGIKKQSVDKTFEDLINVLLKKEGIQDKESFWKGSESETWLLKVRLAIEKYLGRDWVKKFDKFLKEQKKIWRAK